MRVIVVGVGQLGHQLAEDVSGRAGLELVLVEQDEDRAERLSADFDALVIHGDGTDPEILDKAGLAEADALVATTGSDPINTVIAMLAHRAEVAKVIVRLVHFGLEAAVREMGPTEIVAPTIAAAHRIRRVLDEAAEPDVSVLARGGLRLAELRVGDELAGVGIDALELPEGVRAVAVARDDDVRLPDDAATLEAGDVIVVVAVSDEAAERARERVHPS